MGWAGQVQFGLDLKTSDWTVPSALPREDMSLASPSLSQCLNIKLLCVFTVTFIYLNEALAVSSVLELDSGLSYFKK